MANQESQQTAPKVSKLPLPISDSPLVIDLPDGQKIVVGKMTTGSVIEVATWRGVGRPDSRTSRLMLGMGNGNVNEESDEEEKSGGTSANRRPAQPKPAGIKGYIVTVEYFLKNLARINWAGTIKALLSSLTSKKAKQPRASRPDVMPAPAVSVEAQPRPVKATAPVSEDAEIEEWLNKITEKAARSTSASKPAAKKAPLKKAAVAKKAAVTKKAAPKTTNKRK